MRLNSFHADVRQLLNVIGFKYGPLTGESQFVVGAGTASQEWFEGRVPTAQLHYTIEEAIQECVADRGDLILVAPGYTESMASAAASIDLDIAGLSVIGLGHGEIRPTISYTHADAEVVFGADSVRLINFILNAAAADVKKAIDIETTNTHCLVKDCLFTETTPGTHEFLDSICVGDQCNFTQILNNKCFMGTGAANHFVHIDADCDHWEVGHNFAAGDFAVAHVKGDEQDDMIWIHHNTFYNGQETGVGLNAQPCIELAGTTTGVIEYNLCVCNLATKAASIVADDCHLHENYYNEDESGAATSGIIGTASADD